MRKENYEVKEIFLNLELTQHNDSRKTKIISTSELTVYALCYFFHVLFNPEGWEYYKVSKYQDGLWWLETNATEPRVLLVTQS